MKDDLKWLFELKTKVPGFLNRLKGKTKPGFFHYSLSGDQYDENVEWGLGNAVFAVKIYHTLNMLRGLRREDKLSIAKFIKGFQKEGGSICDPLVKKNARFYNVLLAIRALDFSTPSSERTAVAETRQAICALHLLDEEPDLPFTNIPKSKRGIQRYLSQLNWKEPWSAGSHFSHLIFFLKNSNTDGKDDLIDFTVDWIGDLQNHEDGSWYRGNPSLQQRINGAMKIITGLKVANRLDFECSERLVDMCLSAQHNKHACDNLNIVYVMHYAHKLAADYRTDEIRDFALARLRTYAGYYFPEHGAFSFLPGRANVFYYGAKISKGLNEPDIHGTCMFLWGLSIIAQILLFDDKLGFNEQVP